VQCFLSSWPQLVAKYFGIYHRHHCVIWPWQAVKRRWPNSAVKADSRAVVSDSTGKGDSRFDQQDGAVVLGVLLSGGPCRAEVGQRFSDRGSWHACTVGTALRDFWTTTHSVLRGFAQFFLFDSNVGPKKYSGPLVRGMQTDSSYPFRGDSMKEQVPGFFISMLAC
jgi:hypothetical protein